MYWRLAVACLFHTLLGHAVLYHQTAMNPLENNVKNFICQTINDDPSDINWYWSMICSALPAGWLFGSFFIHSFAQSFGRRTTCTTILDLFLISGSLLQFVGSRFAQSVLLLTIGRFLCGFAMPAAFYQLIYLMECAPTQSRALAGMVASAADPTWNALGILLGLRFVFGTDDRWQFSLLVPALAGGLHLCFGQLFPKSPVYLYMVEKDIKAARKALLFYHGPDAELEQAEEHLKHEAQLCSAQSKSRMSLWHVLCTSHLRFPFFICVVANIGKRAGGMDLVHYYSSSIITFMGVEAGTAPLYVLVFLEIPAALSAILAIFIFKMINRVRVFLLCLFGLNVLSISLIFYAQFSFKVEQMSWFALPGIGGLLLAAFSDNIGVSTVPDFLSGELCPQESRSLTASYSFAATATTSMLVALLYPPLEHLWGPWALMPLVLLAIFTFCFMFKFMPETQNRPIAETVGSWVESAEDVNGEQTSYGTMEE